uniref:Uncharacterized protein n=1 Tax=Anguilla anguilla TaxID=7936 RepID=A0A0E9Q092_ANGAN
MQLWCRVKQGDWRNNIKNGTLADSDILQSQ